MHPPTHPEEPPVKPYTDDDVQWIARTIYEDDETQTPSAWLKPWPEVSKDVRGDYLGNARTVLDALAGAGRLLPTDARTAIEDALVASERQRWGDVPDRVAIAEWADEIHRCLTQPTDSPGGTRD